MWFSKKDQNPDGLFVLGSRFGGMKRDGWENGKSNVVIV
jgi:hypothetical protein